MMIHLSLSVVISLIGAKFYAETGREAEDDAMVLPEQLSEVCGAVLAEAAFPAWR